MRHVLLIDDDEEFLELAALGLPDDEFRLSPVRTVSEAKAVLDGGDVDVVVTDLGLEDEGGLDFCRELARTHPKLPVVVVTGFDEARPAARALGARTALLKPIEASGLLDAIRAL